MVLHYIPESGILTGIMHLIPLQDGLVFFFFLPLGSFDGLGLG